MNEYFKQADSEHPAAYVFHEDPGHGWLGVTAEEIHRLGLQNSISIYSYVDHHKSVFYLEEDCDLSVFLRAKEALDETVYYFVRHYPDDCPIRELGRYRP